MKYSYLLQKQMEKWYDGTCTIINYVKNQGILNNTIEQISAENVPCRLSYETVKNAEQTETASKQSQIIKLFFPPDVDVKPGCKIIVSQEGVTNDFYCTGPAAVYGSHKEVVLTLERGYC